MFCSVIKPDMTKPYFKPFQLRLPDPEHHFSRACSPQRDELLAQLPARHGRLPVQAVRTRVSARPARRREDQGGTLGSQEEIEGRSSRFFEKVS